MLATGVEVGGMVDADAALVVAEEVAAVEVVVVDATVVVLVEVVEEAEAWVTQRP